MLREHCRSDTGQHRVGFLNGLLQLKHRIGARHRSPFVELALPLPLVLSPAYSADDPLPNIPCQMQEKIPDAVRLGISPPPHFLIRQLLDAPLDSREIAGYEQVPGLINKRPEHIFVHEIHSRRVSTSTICSFRLLPEDIELQNYTAIPIVRLAVYPLEGVPVSVAISDCVPSENTLSEAFEVGFWPLDA